MPTETIAVPEIHCGNCKASIEGALTPVKGVTRAEVDLTARTVLVDYDPDQVTREKIVQTITEQGYDVPA